MSVIRRLGINRAEKVELFDDIRRLKAERGKDGPLDSFFIDGVCTKRVDMNAERLRMPAGDRSPEEFEVVMEVS